jgi:zinc and cadmium transporter
MATLGVSLLSLVGLLVTSMQLWSPDRELQMLSFAAAILIATSFLTLIPEAIEGAGGAPVLRVSVAAIAGFYLLDRLLERGRGVQHPEHAHPGHASNARYLILIGDSIHNFIDGVAIAVAFMIDPAAGLATTLSVAAHELPHEIGDFAILVRGGFSRTKALAFNLISALTAVLGGLIAFAWRPFVSAHLPSFVAASAGMFLYIAMVNLIPEVQHSGSGRHRVQTLPFLFGLILIFLLGLYLPE